MGKESVMIDTIICGDCLEVMPTLEDKSVDMVLADLPYGTTKLKWDSLIPLDKLWGELSRITKDDSALVFTSSQPFTTTLIASNIKRFRYEWIWCRKRPANFLTANYQPLKIHEDIAVFSQRPATFTKQDRHMRYYPIKETIKHIIYRNKETKSNVLSDYGGFSGIIPGGRVYKDKHPKSIIEFKSHNGSRYHPTQKPVALFEYLIRTYTNEGDTVLDPTAGSGTTAVACHKLNRHYICIEKEPEYCVIAEKRISEML